MCSLRQLFADGSLHVFDYPAFARDRFAITQIDVWDGGFQFSDHMAHLQGRHFFFGLPNVWAGNHVRQTLQWFPVAATLR